MNQSIAAHLCDWPRFIPSRASSSGSACAFVITSSCIDENGACTIALIWAPTENLQALSDREELNSRTFLDKSAEFPIVAHHQYGCAVLVLGHVCAVGFDHPLESKRIVRTKPACDRPRRFLEAELDAIFLFHPRRQHVELQFADDADDPLRSDRGLEQSDYSLFSEIAKSSAHLLNLQWIVEADSPQDLRREIGKASKGKFALFSERIADPERSVIRNPDDVARKRDFGEFPVSREESDRVVDGD